MNRGDVHVRGEVDSCPMCEAGVTGLYTQPEDETMMRWQISSLRRRLDEIDRGELSPEQIRQRMPAMCSMCQTMLGDLGERPNRLEVEERVEAQLERLGERLASPSSTTEE